MFRLSSSSILKNRRQPKDKQKNEKIIIGSCLIVFAPTFNADLKPQKNGR